MHLNLEFLKSVDVVKIEEPLMVEIAGHVAPVTDLIEQVVMGQVMCTVAGKLSIRVDGVAEVCLFVAARTGGSSVVYKKGMVKEVFLEKEMTTMVDWASACFVMYLMNEKLESQLKSLSIGHVPVHSGQIKEEYKIKKLTDATNLKI